MTDGSRGVQGGEAALAIGCQRREREQLAEVKAALTRLDEGVYGRCELCDAPIELGALLDVPWTRYCSDCLADTSNPRASGDLP